MTMIDRTTRWVEVAPMREQKSEAVVRTFLEFWIARFGIPSMVTIDRGAQLRGYLFMIRI